MEVSTERNGTTRNEPGYDGFAADVWSVGILALEIQCGTHVLERALALPKRGVESRRETVRRIVAGLPCGHY